MIAANFLGKKTKGTLVKERKHFKKYIEELAYWHLES